MGIVKNVGYRAICVGIAGLSVTMGAMAVNTALALSGYAVAAARCAIDGPKKTEPKETSEE